MSTWALSSLRSACPGLRQNISRKPCGSDRTKEAAHHHLAVALMQLSNYAAAERHLRQTLRLNPQNPEALNNLGVTFMAQGKCGEAVEVLKEANDLAPGRPIAERNLRNARACSR